MEESGERLWLEKITFTFSQSGNCDGTTEQYEELTVDVVGARDVREDNNYLVLRTSTGWSINSPQELIDLLAVVNEKVKTCQDPV